MPLVVTAFERTPNPNALKCLVTPAPADAPRSYFRADQARDDPLAAALFAIPGVSNVLVHSAFITIGKAPDAEWSSLKPAIKKVLREHP